jgi:GNAT superfamily N-acetyltransferase
MSRSRAVEIRRAGADDARDVARLLCDFNVEYDEPAPPLPEMAQRVVALLAHGDTVILLAGDPACAVSVMRLRPGLWDSALECWLAELYVVPGRRGRGIGRALMEAAMDAARAEGAGTMELGTGGPMSSRGRSTRASASITTSTARAGSRRSACSTNASCSSGVRMSRRVGDGLWRAEGRKTAWLGEGLRSRGRHHRPPSFEAPVFSPPDLPRARSRPAPKQTRRVRRRPAPASYAAPPSASRNLAMIGPSSGPPLAPPLFWTTMANAMSPS